MMVKIFKWSGIFIGAAILLAIGFYAYLVISFDTENFPDNHGKVDTVLFIGEDDNQPLLVGLGGSEGGNAWAGDYWKGQRNEFISQGYAFLAIGYFGAPETPRELDRIALEGVYQAIMDAAEHPQINSDCIAVMGGSKGAELALLLASHYREIKTVVAIAPGNAVFPGLTIALNTPSFTLNGAWLPFVPIPWSAAPALIKGDLRAVWVEMLKDTEAVEKAAIAVENINGPIFFVSATRDEFWPSTEMSRTMERRLKENQFPYHVEHLAVKGGHAAPLKHFDDMEKFLAENFCKEL